MQRYKSPGTEQIPVELIQAGGNTLNFEIDELITSIWSQEGLPQQCKESVIPPIYKKSDKTDCSNYTGIKLLSNTYKSL
jgi:hypothetical protein